MPYTAEGQYVEVFDVEQPPVENFRQKETEKLEFRKILN